MTEIIQTGQVKNSLKALAKVFDGIDDYRVLGSVLVASLNGGLHRELHDVDLLIGERVYGEVVSRFEKLGFKKVTKHAPGFSWDEFEKPGSLTFGVLARGAFTEKHFQYRPSKWLTLQIRSDYLRPTSYELYGVKFQGIPIRSVYEGIRVASLNTKRQRDKLIVLDAAKGKLPSGPSVAQAFRVRLFGVALPFVYSALSALYDLIGGIRLRFGKSYDPWN